MARLTQRPLRQRQTQSGRPRLQIQSAKAIEEGVWHPVLVQRNSLKIGSIPRLCQVQTSSGVSVESTGPFGHGSADASSYPNIFENEESFASPEPLLKPWCTKFHDISCLARAGAAAHPSPVACADLFKIQQTVAYNKVSRFPPKMPQCHSWKGTSAVSLSQLGPGHWACLGHPGTLAKVGMFIE